MNPAIKGNPKLYSSAAELFDQLRELNILAKALNARQHAGHKITPSMWSALYDESQKADKLLSELEKLA